ncbi:thioredoxin family protein [Undibacterium jejuense]|uniref:Thioredoxin family protein n=1 Tax=Undibacterium jejuense TaxID=1344949 RepID=A0A923HHG5_9BURK|nr:thioredoxin family protein [Undibacterium jejuense]MBC3864121.1 thioredoxin family protein [Undibacterium jejuense]
MKIISPFSVKLLAGLVAAVLATSSSFAAESIAPDPHAVQPGGIEWRRDNNLDAAFALAKSSNKPLFLYWGAVWCPPCNQVKATIFNRQEFIEKSRHFIPVYLDGDSPSAQKFGAQFKVRGYPTMILLKPDGTEITRLPGEVDSERYLQVLSLAMNTSTSVNDTYKAALAGAKTLKAEDWSLLADYSWDDPDQKLVAAKEVPATLLRLAEICPPGAAATRLYLKGLFALATAEPAKSATIDKAKALSKLSNALASPKVARDNLDLVAGPAAEVTGYLTTAKSPERVRLVTAWNQALVKLSDDATISKADRLGAVIAQVALAKLDNAALSPSLQKDVKKRVAAIDHATTDAYERQSVVHSAAEALGSADLLDDSDTLLKAELQRSHSPYYFMSTLGSNAKKRGDKAAALSWYSQAYDASKGPATRLQWGANYVGNLVDLAPSDDARIERTVTGIFTELSKTENAFYERNRASLDKMGKKLISWNKDGQHQAVFQKIHAQLDGICAKLPANDPQKASCQTVLTKS